MKENHKKFGLYIHIPFCKTKCDYCDFFSIPNGGAVSDDYLQALLNESIHYSKKLDIQMWGTIYIGGGTPSLLSPRQIEFLLKGLKSAFDTWIDPAEITMEMNPQSLTLEKLDAAYSGGVNRLSLGVQSLVDKSLESVHRMCTKDIAEKQLELVKKHWSGRLNLDCIAGLPGQSEKEFCESLKKIVSYGPDHISLYTLTIEDGTPLEKKISKGMAYDYDEADSQWLIGRDILESCGFHQYEVSNFSRPGCRSLHNMAYWNQDCYVGIGSGATSSVYRYGAGQNGIRWTNTRDIKHYIDYWLGNASEESVPRDVEILDQSTQEFEFLMMGLRTMDGLSADEYRKRFTDLAWKGNLGDRLGTENGPWKRLIEKNMVQIFDSDNRYALNSEGILFLNQILEEYL